jgi:hypothetical protein
MKQIQTRLELLSASRVPTRSENISLVYQGLQRIRRAGKAFDAQPVARCATGCTWMPGRKNSTTSLTSWNQNAKVACTSMRRFAEPLENGPP